MIFRHQRVVGGADRTPRLDAGVGPQPRARAASARGSPSPAWVGSPPRDARRTAVPRSACPATLTSSWANGRRAPPATESCSPTRSRPVTSSVTPCSTCRRVFISKKKKSSPSTRNSTVPDALVLDGTGGRDGRLPHALRVSASRPVPPVPPRRSSDAAVGPSTRGRRGARPSPWLSPMICTSTWRGEARYRSRKTSSEPNAAPASRWPAATASRSASGPAHEAHAPAAAARRRLDEQRIADTGGGPRQVFGGGPGRHDDARQDGHAGSRDRLFGAHLVAHDTHRRRGGTDPDDVRRRARLGQRRVLREEPVARMQRVGAGALRTAPRGQRGRGRSPPASVRIVPGRCRPPRRRARRRSSAV